MGNYSHLLDRLKLPDELKSLTTAQQELLCGEIRHRLIQTVSQNGGHLASNLGVVELTVALHTVFDLPADCIVWDVGHQCYTHKMLTGRLDRFSGIRCEGGISGFPRPSESECDAFIAGHASTSLSAACGIAKANTLTGNPHHAIAVIGDGAFTGGMVYEALNNAGRSNDRIIVVINDNDMSISKNVGSVARYLAEKRTSEGYLNLKDKVEETLVKIPLVGAGMRDLARNSKRVFRQALYHSNLFEDFGFDYLGPVDGHDIPLLLQVFAHAQELGKPVVVHVNTVKGKGYLFAEKNPAKFHGIGAFDRVSGQTPPAQESFSGVFGKRLTEAARADQRICAITAAMQSGTGLQGFATEFTPQNRFFDVGIAEEHAVTFACGLAAGGMLPVFAVYSTFLQRAYDQLIHDASIERQHIVLGIDRAGIIGDDGETHQGLFDAAFLSGIPGAVIYSPATYADLDYALDRALYHCDGVAAVRYPRGAQSLPDESLVDRAGEYFHLQNGGQTLIITYGREFSEVCGAMKRLSADGKTVDLLRLNRIAPIPGECVTLAKKYRAILFAEEGVKSGGIGEHFLAALSEAGYRGRLRIAAIEKPFIAQMSLPSALRDCGLDAAAIAEKVSLLYF